MAAIAKRLSTALSASTPEIGFAFNDIHFIGCILSRFSLAHVFFLNFVNGRLANSLVIIAPETSPQLRRQAPVIDTVLL